VIIQIVINIPLWLERLLIFPVLVYRRLHYGYPFRRIPLTRGKSAIVDPDDYYRLCNDKWFATKNGATFYAKRHTRKKDNSKHSSICMHRIIMNAPDHLVVDHINYNGLDNRKANLRLATRRQNSIHVIRTMKPGSSKFKGVSRHTGKNKWGAQITSHGKTTFLGYFEDEIEAAKVYDEAAKKFHGEFAALNFP
jgi:hypothetical protein